MNNLLKIEVNSNQEQTVSGRELYAFLGIAERFSKWWDRMIGYGFTENIDFTSVQKSTVVNNGAEKPIIDHIMKLDMAKELCMLARNDKGKQARQYFLEVEREWNSPEKVMARALMLAEAKLNEVKAFAAEQTKQLEAAQPKVIFADAVATAQTSILIGDLAKILKQNGVNTGQNRLFEWLRQNGYLIRQRGTSYNSPTQRAMEIKLFEVKETSVAMPDGGIKISRTTKVTGKGQIYFVNLFKKQSNAG